MNFRPLLWFILLFKLSCIWLPEAYFISHLDPLGPTLVVFGRFLAFYCDKMFEAQLVYFWSQSSTFFNHFPKKPWFLLLENRIWQTKSRCWHFWVSHCFCVFSVDGARKYFVTSFWKMIYTINSAWYLWSKFYSTGFSFNCIGLTPVSSYNHTEQCLTVQHD